MLVLRLSALSSQEASLLGISKRHRFREDLEVEDIPDIVYDVAQQAFESLSLDFDREVNPWDDVCEEATCELRCNLPRAIKAKRVWYSGSETEDGHVFLVLSYKRTKWLVDPTYQQYLSLEERAYLPTVLICRLTNKEALIESLEEHNIQAELHHIWTNPLFDKED